MWPTNSTNYSTDGSISSSSSSSSSSTVTSSKSSCMSPMHFYKDDILSSYDTHSNQITSATSSNSSYNLYSSASQQEQLQQSQEIPSKSNEQVVYSTHDLVYTNRGQNQQDFANMANVMATHQNNENDHFSTNSATTNANNTNTIAAEHNYTHLDYNGDGSSYAGVDAGSLFHHQHQNQQAAASDHELVDMTMTSMYSNGEPQNYYLNNTLLLFNNAPSNAKSNSMDTSLQQQHQIQYQQQESSNSNMQHLAQTAWTNDNMHNENSYYSMYNSANFSATTSAPHKQQNQEQPSNNLTPLCLVDPLLNESDKLSGKKQQSSAKSYSNSSRASGNHHMDSATNISALNTSLINSLTGTFSNASNADAGLAVSSTSSDASLNYSSVSRSSASGSACKKNFSGNAKINANHVILCLCVCVCFFFVFQMWRGILCPMVHFTIYIVRFWANEPKK